VDFGMIVGLNGGKFWTYAANDFYKTIDPSTGQQVNVKSILGLVSDPSHRFERNAASADNNNGCRVIPGPCSGNEQYVAGSSTTDASLYSSINSSGITGTASDKAGRSASGIPIVPLFINGGLPSVNSRFGYPWTAGGRPAVNFASGGTFGPTFTSTGTSTTFRLRTRNDTTPPRVEFCDATYLTNNLCTSSSWVPISLPAGTTANPTVTISENFASNSFSGTSNDRWPTAWAENDTASGGTGVSAGNVLVQSGVARLRFVSGAQSWSTATNRAAIARVVNLHALQSPHLTFTQTVAGLSGTNATLEVRFSTNNAAINTDTGWTSLMTTNASGGTTGTGASCSGSGTTRTCRVPIPLAAQTGYTKIRFRANLAYSTSQSVSLDDVKITNNAGGDVSLENWCEYSTTRPNTAQFIGGFHCLGPLLGMGNGGDFIVDTSGGNINFYYNSSSDTRGTSLSSPLINMANSAELLHVNCPNSGALTEPPSPTGAAVTPSNNCLTGIPTTVYAAVGENDLLNIFGRDTPPNNSTSNPTMQWVRIGSTSASPGKISGAFFYMPYGSVYLVQDQCSTGGTNPNATFNFNGRIWSRFLIACGVSYFLTPPSSTLNLQALGINSNISLNTSGFVGSTGTDWVATTATATRVNSGL
jgi:hypothetical protein